MSTSAEDLLKTMQASFLSMQESLQSVRVEMQEGNNGVQAKLKELEDQFANNSLEMGVIRQEMKKGNQDIRLELNEVQEKIQTKLKDIDKTQEETDRRLKAKETFPTPPYGTSPQQTNVVTHGSVSSPKWGKRSIFG